MSARPATRKQRALATRRRILGAAYELFRAHGYARTTMEAIANEAGVAVQTLYFTFHTKAALLEEVVGAAVTGFDTWEGPHPPLHLGDVEQLRTFHDWFAPFEAERTAQGALKVFITAGVQIMERAAPLTTTMREATGDPEAKRVYDLGELRRADAYHAVIRIVSKKPPGLAPGLTVRRAADILFAVFSPETYQMLRDRGWKPHDVRTWLLKMFSQHLLAP